MSYGDLSRINTNVQSMSALGQLQKTNSQLGMRQMRLSTGSRINRAEDDSAGFAIATKLQAKTRGQAQALSNIGDAKGMLTVAEGSLNSTMDILQTMKEKVVQAGNDTMGRQERLAVHNQLNALQKEVTDTLDGTTFNGKDLFSDDSAGTSFTFQVNAESGDTFEAEIGRMSGAALGTEASDFTQRAYGDSDKLSSLTLGGTNSATEDTSYKLEITSVSGNAVSYKLNDGTEQNIADVTGNSGADGVVTLGDGITIDLNDSTNLEVGTVTVTNDKVGVGVNTNASAGSALSSIDAAINTVANELGNIGDSQSRLSFKQDNLQTSMTNYEAARSRIADADFAKEQMEIVKLQILQQTGIGQLAQSNSAPQSVMSLL